MSRAAMVVPGAAAPMAEIAERLPSLLPPAFGRVRIVVVKEVPRTANGKVRRNLLDLRGALSAR